MMRKPKHCVLLVLLSLFYYSSFSQTTFPVNDVATPQDDGYAFINATIVKDANTTLQNASMIIRKGKIIAVGSGIAIPKDVVVVDCKGKYIYPSFFDAYTDYGTEPISTTITPGQGRFSQMTNTTKGAVGWNQAIRSETDIYKSFTVNEAKAKELRNVGFGTVLTHQDDGISRGTGAVVTLANNKENKVMLKERASANYSFDKGSSTQDYPNSLMGSTALLRQNFLDAQWYKTKPVAEGVNISLQSFLDNQTLPQIFESNDKWSDLRADKVGDEFGVQYIIKGAGNEYQRLNEVKATNASYILPLVFPETMDVEDPTDARFVSLATLKNWELAPTNLSVMAKANINFAITTYGLKSNSSFTSSLRKAMDAGLDEKTALNALTKVPAMLLNVYDQVGSLETGKLANFLILSGPVFEEKTVLYQNWIQGDRYIVKTDGWDDKRGNYKLTVNGNAYTLSVKGEPDKLSATVMAADTMKTEFSIMEKLVKIYFSAKKETGLTRLSGIASDSSWSGTGQLPDGKWVSWTATKTGEYVAAADTSKKKKTDADKKIGEVVYPFNGYGYTQAPKQETLLIKNATVWTNEKEGVLANTDVLVKNGKIAAIGKSLSDASAKVIDGTGKHLSPGLIDEHSHIAVTGGINECSQSVTAECRVADALDPEDIDIYRQLSGGLTTAHVLHGSCNTIGGQTQLIKLRWGVAPEQMKFANWDPFIKFALGENVKRSSTQNNPRYPDTRMGVEEILTDAFTRATDYMKQGPGKRRDLELDALAEILQKKRFITCHSYVQSEINSLIKVADKFGFTVNTFTHILEGYKVADKLKAHGSAASTFSDWWSYKMEVVDAIPQNAGIMQKVGLTVAINSDDPEMARRLNQEAAKSVKYTGLAEEDALKMVTLNPATMLHIADRVGSIKVGKDADLVLWSDDPLSIYAKALTTIVDGTIYFDRQQDSLLRINLATEKNRLIQKMIAAKKGGDKTTPAVPSSRPKNYCEEEGHGSHDLWERLEERANAIEGL